MERPYRIEFTPLARAQLARLPTSVHAAIHNKLVNIVETAVAMPRAFLLGQEPPPRTSTFEVEEWRGSYTVDAEERILTVVELVRTSRSSDPTVGV